jgi:hypothetical protein
MSAGQPLNLGLNGARAPSGSVCNCPRMPRGLGTWRARDEGLRTADLARVSQLDCDVCSSVRGGRWFLFQPTRAAYTLRPTTGSRSTERHVCPSRPSSRSARAAARGPRRPLRTDRDRLFGVAGSHHGAQGADGRRLDRTLTAHHRPARYDTNITRVLGDRDRRLKLVALLRQTTRPRQPPPAGWRTPPGGDIAVWPGVRSPPGNR